MSKSYKVIIGIVAAVLLVGAGYWWMRVNGVIFSVERGVGVEYIVRSTNNNPMCGDDEVLTKDGTHIVTLHLCEDNIKSVTKAGDWITVTTTAGRTYRKNLVTGKETIVNKGGVGGMSKIE